MRHDQRVDVGAVMPLVFEVRKGAIGLVAGVRAAVDDDIPALEDAVPVDAVVERVNPDRVAVAHVDEVHLQEGIRG